eukprot:scpid8408/ scgid15940/ Proto-oncogene tyrosine-protein kinase ROS; Proto-oncogene c-Ros; Proto-oncogene c-Ros-1; Receptor tyrosine kinase c-ros oncogene 1; c-Ros receptor tyrosine kinase
MIARELWRCSSRWILLIMSSVLCRSAVGASCVTRLENATAISQCATLCSDQLTNSSAITSITLLVQRQRLSGQCAEHCRLAYTRGMCHCRDGCLDSLPCLTACGLTGSYNGIASNATALKMCVRTMVQPDLTLRTNIYWMPLESDLRLMGMITNSSVYYHAPELHKSESEKEYSISGIALFHYYNISSPLSFPLLKTIRNGSSAGQSVAPYNVGVRVADVTYYMPGAKPIAQQRLDNNRVGGRTGDYVLFSTPECNQVKDHFSKCADPQYADVSSPTQYYDPINVSGFNAKSNTMANPVRAAQQDAPVEQSYQLALALRWTYQLFEHVPRDSAAPGVIAHAYDSCTPHSCWCWESCAVQHRVSLDVIVNDDLAMRYNHTMDFVEEQEDDYVHCPNIRVNRSFSVDIPATNLLLGRIADSSLLGTELVNVSVTASIQSYYVVDKYFGPLQKSSIITYSLVDIPVYLKDPSKEDNDHTSPPSNTSTPPHTAFANTMSSNNTATSRSPGRIPHTSVSAVADGQSVAMEIIVPVVMVILLAVMGVGGLIFIRMWRYQKWRPRCVAKNSTLEKLHQLPVQTITNDGYQALKSDWPAVTRNCINLELQLGSGQFGEVYKATVANLIPREAVTQVAVKVLKQGSSPKDEHDFLLEATHLKNFRHPNVIRLLGVCLDEHPKMIILELMDGGDLLSYLQANQPGAARPAWDDAEYIDIALDITAGLRYLETEKYVHRDVAARNCLVSFNPENSSLAVKPSSSGRIVKIADFGLARDIDRRDYYRIMDDKALVPVRWMSPESLQDKLFTGKSDVWAFGILLWEIFTYGQTPYGEHTSVFDVYKFVTMGGILDQPQFCPTAMYKLMKQTWGRLARDRPTFRQLHDHLSTFQKSLNRRKTLLTTLASFASVSGITDVERSQLPHIPSSQRVKVAPRASSAEGSVFDNDSDLSDSCFDYSPYASDFDNAFETPTDSPTASRRLTPSAHRPSPLLNGGNALVPPSRGASHYQQQRRRRKSRSHSASREDVTGKGAGSPAVKSMGLVPVQANGTAASRRGYGYVAQRDMANASAATLEQADGAAILVTECTPRKPLSPIVSASSAPGDEPSTDSTALTDVDRPQLERIPSAECVVLPTRASLSEGNVFDDESELSDSCFDYSPQTSDVDNAFESAADSPTAARRSAPAEYKPSPLLNRNNNLVPNGVQHQNRRQRRRSSSNSTSREGAVRNGNGPLPVKSMRSFPLKANGSGSSGRGYGYVSKASFANGYAPQGSVAQDSSAARREHSGPPMLVSEYSARKPLSPIVSASSVPDESCTGVAAVGRRTSRADSSGSCVRSICTETSL